MFKVTDISNYYIFECFKSELLGYKRIKRVIGGEEMVLKQVNDGGF